MPREVDGLRVVIRDETGEERTVGVFELLRCPEEIVHELPFELTLPTSKGARWVSVQGLRLGLVVLTAEVRLQAGVWEAEIWIDSGCLGLECPRGQSCLGGGCTISPASESILGACGAGGPSLDAGPSGDPGDGGTEASDAEAHPAGEDPGVDDPDAAASDAENTDPGADYGVCGPPGGAP